MPSGWLENLRNQIDRAEGEPDRLTDIFDRLRAEVGPAEASRRWWAAFAATDASAT